MTWPGGGGPRNIGGRQGANRAMAEVSQQREQRVEHLARAMYDAEMAFLRVPFTTAKYHRWPKCYDHRQEAYRRAARVALEELL